MAKEPQELKWMEGLLPEEGYRRRPMFGGFAYYIDEKIILVTFESPGDRSYRGKKFPYEIWQGCMFPIEREHHEKALRRYSFLVTHPVVQKWLYLPLETENFEDLVSDVMAQVLRPASYWGVIPKAKNKTAGGARRKKIDDEKIDTKIDTRTPRMFSEEPAKDHLQKAKKISDLKNFGPAMEQAFHKAGIKTAPAFIKMGWQKAFKKLVQKSPKHRHSMVAYALIGALQNVEWNRIAESDKAEARLLAKSLKKSTKK